MPQYQAPSPGHTAPVGPRYANWGWRVLSSLIDTLVFYAPMFVAMGLLSALGLLDADGDPVGVFANVVVGLSALAAFTAAVVNRIVLDGRGRSLGRWVTGTKLISSRTGAPVGPGRAALRMLCHILDSIPMNIGYLLPLFLPERQTVADLLVRTVVVRTRA